MFVLVLFGYRCHALIPAALLIADGSSMSAHESQMALRQMTPGG
jgi:hypothetical protein